MSDNPDDTSAVPAAEPPVAPAAPAPAAAPATTSVRRFPALPLVITGLVGLLLGCLIGGSVVAFVAAVHEHHGRPGVHMRDDRGPRFNKRGEQPQMPMYPRQNPQGPAAPQPGNPQPAPSSVGPTS